MAVRAPSCSSTHGIHQGQPRGLHLARRPAQPDPQVLPGLFYLRNGTRLDLSDGAGRILVGGLGGCFGPSDYGRPSKQLQSYAKRHYTRDEIDGLIASGRIDVLLVHDAPAGVRFERHHRGAGYVSETAGLDDLLRSVHPRVCFFGHHHSRFDATVDGIPCVGLNNAVTRSALLVDAEKADHLPNVPDFDGGESGSAL